MEALQSILKPLQPYSLELLFACVVVALLLFVWLFVAVSRLNGQAKRLKEMLAGSSGESLEGLIKECLTGTRTSADRLGQIDSHLKSLEDNQQLCLQKVGLVRYDAYDDVHGKQSFSVALLNAQNSGTVITGLFGRTDARCYGKPIVNGKSEYALSEEEAQAVQVATHRVEVPRT